jgi:hypothetical protein
MTTRAAVAGCRSSSSSPSVAGRGRGGGGVAAASAIAINKPSRVPRLRALPRLELPSVDARRSQRFYEAEKKGLKADRSAPARAAVGGDAKGDDSTTTTPSTSSSSPSSSQTAQEQRDLDLIRRAQADDAGTSYPLEETRVSKRHKNRVKTEWLDQANSSSHRLNLDLLDFGRPNQKQKTLPPSLNKQRLVDTAMLSAIGGLAYVLGSVLRLQAYMG